MKKRIKKIIYRLIGLLPSSAVLMLHNITDHPKLNKSIVLSHEKFLLLVNSFNNWSPINAAVKKPSSGVLAMTFDDGFEDVYTVAYPYLKSQNVPFTVFVTVEKLNTEGYLTTEQLKELADDNLCTIGAHCYNHLPLAKLSYEEQKKELITSKCAIEKIIDKPVTLMAFPYGSYNASTLKILRETKSYTASFIVGRGFLNFISGFSRYEKPRIPIDNESFDKNFKLLLNKYNGDR
ncbi:MAG: polysaccharide deacetylase family protein [Clostridia bacterium]|nr:polysaccharide deacetylase family protein [Clostridia bacterium]